MKLVVLSSVLAAASAFSPTSSVIAPSRGTSCRQSTPEPVEEDGPAVDEIEAPPPSPDPINFWVPDANLPCYGLPGAVAPTGYFDPIGFAQTGISLNDVKRFREAELQHGRVAMIACLGYFAGEAIDGPFGAAGPANDQLAQLPFGVVPIMGLLIGAAELRRATIGWVEPNPSVFDTLFALRENYYPGDIGFDPLGLKPTDKAGFETMQTKELQNGRLAMIGAAGMCAQELVNHKTIMDTLEFYQKVYSGGNPYE